MHKYRPQLLEKISGVILIGEKDKSVKASLGFRTAKNSDKTALINSFVSYLDVFSRLLHLIDVFCHISFLLSRYLAYYHLLVTIRWLLRIKI